MAEGTGWSENVIKCEKIIAQKKMSAGIAVRLKLVFLSVEAEYTKWLGCRIPRIEAGFSVSEKVKKSKIREVQSENSWFTTCWLL